MAKQIINVGLSANDKSGDPLRTAFTKVNENFTELYDAVVAIPADVSDLTDRSGLLSGGSSGDTIETPITGGTDGAETALDLTKRTHVLKDGWYSLAAGTEGQVMHFVPHSSVINMQSINIRVNNGRFNNSISVTDYANNFITVFSGAPGAALVTAIYADGAWNFDKGSWD
jgi:hypothetical protein